MPLPTLRRPITKYTASSVASATARPPSTFTQWSSTKPTFCGGSWNREGASTGRMDASSARSVVRAARLPDRTAANVAAASTSVPPAVANEEIVDQSAIVRSYGRAVHRWPGSRPLRCRFVVRHRLVAAIALVAVVVIGALVWTTRSSGAIPGAGAATITARLSTTVPAARTTDVYAGLGAWVDGFDYGPA